MKVLTEELVRAVVWHAIRHYTELDDVVTGAIATHAAAKLAGVVVDGYAIGRDFRSGFAIGLERGHDTAQVRAEVTDAMVREDRDVCERALQQHMEGVALAAAFDRTITGQPAAELTARPNEAVREHPERRVDDEDTVVVDVELGGES